MFSNFLSDTLVVVVVLGFMIFVHELGHFMAAKWFGVRVLTFSFGFGKRLFGFKHRFSFGALEDNEQDRGTNATDYRVSVLPFGGYLRMAGEDHSKSRKDEPGDFLGRPRWQRFVIVMMGPTMNVLTALALLAGLYKYHSPKPAYEEQPARIGDIVPDSPAARAGFLPEDLILRFDDLTNPKWEDVDIKVLTAVGEAIPLEVAREGHILNLTVTPKADGRNEVGYVGWVPYVPAIVGLVEPGLPASQADLKPGDRIVALDGHKIGYSPALAYLLQSGKGKQVELTVERAGKEFQVRLKPVYSEVMGEKKWRIGVAFRNDMVVRQLPWAGAIAASFHDNLRNSLVTFDVLARILTRRMSTRSLSGPIGIAQLSGEAYRAGIPELLVLVAFISLQLGIFNLLPVPILDGGAIMLLLIEASIGRDLSLKIKERVTQAGMVFLLLLAVFLMYNDLVKTFRPY